MNRHRYGLLWYDKDIAIAIDETALQTTDATTPPTFSSPKHCHKSCLHNLSVKTDHQNISGVYKKRNVAGGAVGY
jgi:hypothetical protein